MELATREYQHINLVRTHVIQLPLKRLKEPAGIGHKGPNHDPRRLRRSQGQTLHHP